MILHPGEKVHVVHSRIGDIHVPQHFIGLVDYCEGSLVRVTGHVFHWDNHQHSFAKFGEKRTRVFSLANSDIVVNLLPSTVALEHIAYKEKHDSIRITDGSDWYMDISENSWA